MANEITVSCTLSINNGKYITSRSRSATPTQNASGFDPQILSAVTAANGTLHTTSGITTEGWTYFANLDATNYVDWGQNNSGTIQPVGRLQPGDFVLMRLEPAQAIRFQANTGACEVEILVAED